MNIHTPSIVSFLKATPFGRDRSRHLHLLGSAIDHELTGKGDAEALFLSVLDMFPYAARTWRPLASHTWSQGDPLRGLQDVQVGLFFTGMSATTPHNQSPRLPCRALDVVHVVRLNGTAATDRACNIDWTEVLNWRT